jgi:hypothetical protein
MFVVPTARELLVFSFKSFLCDLFGHKSPMPDLIGNVLQFKCPRCYHTYATFNLTHSQN